MANKLRNFEPGSVWAKADGTLSERAQGWMRSLFEFVGANTGALPVGTLGGDGVSTTTFFREDGSFAVPDYPTGAAPTGQVGEVAAPGVATTFMRSDAAPALNLAISPTWTGAHIFSAGVTFDGLVTSTAGISTTTLAMTGALTGATSGTFSGALSGGSVVAVGAFGCNAQPAQTAFASGGAVATTGATNIAPYGYATAGEADAIVTLVNNIRAALVANGIMT